MRVVVGIVALAGTVATLWLLWRRRPAGDDPAGDREDRSYGGEGYKPPEDE